MSKETTAGVVCRCGNTIYFDKEHWPHCSEHDSWKPVTKKKDEAGKSRKKQGVSEDG